MTALELPFAAPRQYQPYYVAYARAHGREPAEQREHDRREWPAGRAVPYIIWIGERWREWRALVGMDRDAQRGPQHHEAFGAWLAARD